MVCTNFLTNASKSLQIRCGKIQIRQMPLEEDSGALEHFWAQTFHKSKVCKDPHSRHPALQDQTRSASIQRGERCQLQVELNGAGGRMEQLVKACRVAGRSRTWWTTGTDTDDYIVLMVT